MSVRNQHYCTQKVIIGLAAAILLAGFVSTGYAFLLTPAQMASTSPWVCLADFGILPEDGTPVCVRVAVPDRDAWTRKPDRSLGNVFLRRVPGTDEIVALRSISRYGCTIEYDAEARQFHDRRCWGFHFDMDGKCVDPHPHSDLLKLDVQIREGRVYISLREMR